MDPKNYQIQINSGPSRERLFDSLRLDLDPNVKSGFALLEFGYVLADVSSQPEKEVGGGKLIGRVRKIGRLQTQYHWNVELDLTKISGPVEQMCNIIVDNNCKFHYYVKDRVAVMTKNPWD